jgi:FxsC-like protein
LPYFFLSRAAGDDDYVRRFYRDLSAEVRRSSGIDGEVGFMDVAGPTGGRWPGSVADALGTCRVFVALCSPQYFLTERCGREWSVFAERLRRHRAASGTIAPALIPVVWANAGASGEPIGIGDEAHPVLIPPSPGGAGLRQLIRLNSWRASYLEFVSSLARRIVDTADAHAIAPAPPGVDLETAPNAFDLPDPDATTRHEGDGAPTRQRVHFVVAAGSPDEMGLVRNDVRYYGARRQDWAPYRPSLPEPLAARARSLAAERLFGSEVADLDGLPDRIHHAHRNNDIVVLLVDAWATKLEAYRSRLVEFDCRGESAVGVLVPASCEDAETARHRAELRSDVSATFRNTAARRDPMFRTEIGTVAGFDNDLMAVLEAAQNHIYSKGRIFRRPAGAPSTDRPILEGP